MIAWQLSLRNGRYTSPACWGLNIRATPETRECVCFTSPGVYGLEKVFGKVAEKGAACWCGLNLKCRLVLKTWPLVCGAASVAVEPVNRQGLVAEESLPHVSATIDPHHVFPRWCSLETIHFISNQMFLPNILALATHKRLIHVLCLSCSHCWHKFQTSYELEYLLVFPSSHSKIRL